jgi:chromosome partitioning protein
MQVLAIIAQKGGVGKSMLARSLAVQALIDGRKTAIVDADPQGTVVAWGRRRTLQAPAVMALGAKIIPDALSELRARGAEFVVIDTPPHAQPIINLAAKAADIALLVTGPYPEDLEQVGVVAGIVQALRIPAGIILNKTPVKAHALTLARAALAAFRLPICPTAITQLVSHPYASAEGLTAQEREPDSKATAELVDAWSWIKGGLLASKDTRIVEPTGVQ